MSADSDARVTVNSVAVEKESPLKSAVGASTRKGVMSAARGFGFLHELRTCAMFRWFLPWNLLSKLGDNMSTIVMIGLVESFAGGSALAVSGFLFARLIAKPILSPFVGFVVDRFDNRVVTVVTDALKTGIMALSAIFLSGVSDSGYLLWLLYALVFAQNCVAAFSDPADKALVRRMCQRKGFSEVNIYLEVSWSIGEVVGLAGGGALSSALGARQVLIGNAVAFAVAGLAKVRLYFMPKPENWAEPIPDSDDEEEDGVDDGADADSAGAASSVEPNSQQIQPSALSLQGAAQPTVAATTGDSTQLSPVPSSASTASAVTDATDVSTTDAAHLHASASRASLSSLPSSASLPLLRRLSTSSSQHTTSPQLPRLGSLSAAPSTDSVGGSASAFASASVSAVPSAASDSDPFALAGVASASHSPAGAVDEHQPTTLITDRDSASVLPYADGSLFRSSPSQTSSATQAPAQPLVDVPNSGNHSLLSTVSHTTLASRQPSPATTPKGDDIKFFPSVVGDTFYGDSAAQSHAHAAAHQKLQALLAERKLTRQRARDDATQAGFGAMFSQGIQYIRSDALLLHTTFIRASEIVFAAVGEVILITSALSLSEDAYPVPPNTDDDVESDFSLRLSILAAARAAVIIGSPLLVQFVFASCVRCSRSRRGGGRLALSAGHSPLTLLYVCVLGFLLDGLGFLCVAVEPHRAAWLMAFNCAIAFGNTLVWIYGETLLQNVASVNMQGRVLALESGLVDLLESLTTLTVGALLDYSPFGRPTINTCMACLGVLLTVRWLLLHTRVKARHFDGEEENAGNATDNDPGYTVSGPPHPQPHPATTAHYPTGAAYARATC